MNISCPLSHHHLCQGERTSSTAWPQVWHCCPHLGWKLRFWGHSMNPSLTVVVSPFRKSWWSRHTAKKSTDLVYWSIFREPDLMIKCHFALNGLSPQVRIFGVTVLVAAWWLDAAARGIPPTIPVVNFNTVMMMRGVEWMDNMIDTMMMPSTTMLITACFRLFSQCFLIFCVILGNPWHLQKEPWKPTLQQGRCVIWIWI